MPLRRGTPLTFTPSGASDAVDGSTAPPGAMRALTNLIPDPSTRGVWGPRPAALLKADAIPNENGVPSALLVVGDIAYGMVPSTNFPGLDVPFLYDVANNSYTTIVGMNPPFLTNLPRTQPSSGDWTPPIMAQVGNRIIVTHPGFPGGDIKFGWIDLSETRASFFGNVTTDINALLFVTGLFSLLGLEPGLEIEGGQIPPGAVIVRTYDNALAGFRSGSSTTAGSTTVSVNEMTGFRENSMLFGDGIQAGAIILSRSAMFGPGTITMSAPATATVTGLISAIVPTSQAPAITSTMGLPGGSWVADAGSTARYYRVGQVIGPPNFPAGTKITVATAGTITTDQNATVTGTAVPSASATVIEISQASRGDVDTEEIAVTGGFPTAPLWGAGDTDRNPLPSVPVGVAQFNGRAYYACGKDGIAFSDPLQPCRRTNASQALTTGDGLAVTAVAPLMLGAPITGGVVQAIIVFEGTNVMRQITGDPVTSNLAMNLLPVATGTEAPLSVVAGNNRTWFISPDGLRYVDLSANVSEPVGDFGDGIVVPFHNALYPSRICAAIGSSVLRITVQNGAVADNPFQEWWYDISLRKWHGPHTFPAALIQRWDKQFLLAGVGLPGQLWSSTVAPAASDSYVENGQVLTCIAETVLLPDTGLMAMNAMIQATLACSGARQINYQVLDEDGNPLDFVGVPINDVGVFRQRPIYFHQPIIFKQMRVIVTAQADQTLRLGNFYWRYQILGWTAQADLPAPGAFL